MHGPFNLTNEKVDEQVTQKSPGNYALGKISNYSFRTLYVGRSDTDLNKRLKDWVGKYDLFMYRYAYSEKAAFEEECRSYHEFGGAKQLDNDYHPARRDGSDFTCPVCAIYD